jgi:hypothetical protein
MAIPHVTVLKLVNKGINDVDDLAEFDKETINQIASNLCHPAVAPVAGDGFVFGAKLQK